MIPDGIEDEYEIVKILQETAATAVLLVNYKKIGALRILKAVHRAHPNANSILSEAHLLQGINSSQIPTIYNVEDTDEMYYLIEEFIEGTSLREYLLETKLSKEELLKISIGLCDIILALHSAKPEPVLYRDMKPEHVILKDGKVYLIDFGISIRKSETARAVPLGTKNWAAPEQLSGESLDERCDVYGVGKIIEFMQMNSYAKDDFRLTRLVGHATAENLDERTISIEMLKGQLIDLQENKTNKNNGKSILEKTIAVVGTDNSVGTTHIAINMCKFLNKHGFVTYYKDLEKDTVHNLMENFEEAYIKDGVLYHDNFKGILNYGDAVEEFTPPNGLYVTDCGTNIDNTINSDIILMVTNPSPWHSQNYSDVAKSDSVYVLSNMSTKLSCIKLAKELKKKVYMYPLSKDFKGPTRDEERIFSKILRNEKDFAI